MPISWVLLTTNEVKDLEKAIDIILKYKYRWEIELLFATMKSKGLKVELGKLSMCKSLKALCVFVSLGAHRIMQLGSPGRWARAWRLPSLSQKRR